MPTRGDLDTLLELAAKLALATTVDDGLLRGNASNILHVLLVARDLDIAVTAALQQIHVIDGKISISPRLKLALISKAGIGRIWPDPGNDDTVGTACTSRDGRDYTRTVTWADAQQFGKIDGRCKPAAHHTNCRCKANYKRYPGRMLWWRAAGWLADEIYPEATHGHYSPDELGADTDGDGRPIDIDEITPTTTTPPVGAVNELIDDAATVTQRNALQKRIDLLDDGQRNWLRVEWVGAGLAPLDRLACVEVGAVNKLIDDAADLLTPDEDA